MHDTNLHGFHLESIQHIEELGGSVHKLTHIQTGAQVTWLDNGLENKVFAIAFKTIPWDDTGVFHILEHSVLCGSKKFPVKEPFVELLKGSMQTYLNAFTFPDKTVYPVSSRNDQDFMNLVQVYLDAVFCPAIYSQKNIFFQEGWHYAMSREDSDPVYKGVVLNEMKGSCGTVDSIMDNELCRLLYPDTCYRYISGGDPVSIPKLTYEGFLQAHKDFYHPSNARIYLDGKVPLERILKLLDEDYLSKYQRPEKLPEIPLQIPVAPVKKNVYFEIGKEEDPEDKAHMILGKQLCSWSDRKTILAFDILAGYLTGSNASALKQAVLDSELAQDVYLYVNDGMAQPYFALCLRNCNEADFSSLIQLCKDTVKSILQVGLDTQELTAIINHLEFMLLEAEEPRGIQRAITALATWLYGGDPVQALQYKDVLQQLRQEIGTGYYEHLLEELFLKEDLMQVGLLPSKTVGDEQRAAEKAALQAAKESWSDAQLQNILRENQNLALWQATDNTPEAIASLPKLSLQDISPLPEETETQIRFQEDAAILYHPVDTQGVVHLRLYFSLSDLPLERFSELSLLCDLYGDLPTDRYSPAQIQQKIKANIGSLHIAPVCYTLPEDPEGCKPFLAVSISLLKQNLTTGLELVADLLKNTRFEDSQRIHQILLQNCEDLAESIQDRGDQFAGLRCLKNHSAAVAIREMVDGYSLLERLQAFEENFETQLPEFTSFARYIADQICVPQRLTLSQTSGHELPAFETIAPLLGAGAPAPAYRKLSLPKENLKEAIVIPSSISCTACGENMLRFQTPFSGKMQVLSGLLSYSYLWNEIRVKGGAYGCAFGAGASGNLTFSSYQDPTPLKTLDIYGSTAEFIRAFCASDEALEKYIISTLSACDPLQSPKKRGAVADGAYFTNLTYAERCRQHREILSLKKEDLLSLVPLFEQLKEQRSLCMICHEGVAAELDDSWSIIRL